MPPDDAVELDDIPAEALAGVLEWEGLRTLGGGLERLVTLCLDISCLAYKINSYDYEE